MRRRVEEALVIAAVMVIGLVVPAHAVEEPSTAVTLSGHVSGEGAGPLEGVSVTVTCSSCSGWSGASVMTDAEGHYETKVPRAPSVSVRVSTSADYWVTSTQDVAGNDEAVLRHDRELVSGGRFSGRVVDSAGEPVSGATVTAGLGTARTGTDGRFLSWSQRPGAKEVRAFGDRLRQLDASLPVSASPGVTEDVGDLRLEDAATLQAVVVDASGSPVPGHSVSWARQGASSDWSKTDEEGRARFIQNPMESRGRLSLDGPDTVPVSVEVSLTKVGLNGPSTLVSRGRARLRVRVVDDRGVPVRSVAVRTDEASASTDSDGRATLKLLPGRQEISTSDPARRHFVARTTVDARADTSTSATLRVRRGVYVRGLVTTVDGASPEAHARVEVPVPGRPVGQAWMVPSYAWAKRFHAEASDDASGRYRLGLLPAGTYRIVVGHPSRPRLSRVVRLSPGVDATVDARLKVPYVRFSETPRLLGTVKVGRTVSIDPGQWESGGSVVEYRWYARHSRVPGVSGRTWRLPEKFRGAAVRAAVVVSRPGRTKTIRYTGWRPPV